MQFTDKDKTAVTLTVNGNTWTVPRGHRFWQEFGIDKAEQQGSIADAPELAIDGSGGSGGADAV